ncbi:DEAD/DEAH box helicase [Candidatus Berkiella aquae]|uniref:ATP-dependent RNA helicase DbpA n=1 Tax=Candidatus Berkiella aquae TaxID=295108 RepID=A0A0Q9YNV4_9GAMM|nr:DEAD/DEAH box helicase [Candidatus Berkiella aquae]MCS5712160.1 DEAD/DEAH box helicase [Candidatus Berkiella aquae]
MSINHLAWAHPLIQTWFNQTLGLPTEPQQQGWPAILAGKSTLISAPTGSGKTLSAFMICLNELVSQALEGRLDDQTTVLYISPLKALSNDIQKNLLQPLAQIKQLAHEQQMPMQEIRVAVRTGDTLTKERQAMLRHPPHILITTPESLYILLTAVKSRALLASVKTVIVDEIHVMADDKRGTHLSLSLERLEALTTISPIRIGLSATQKPLEIVAQFLTGSSRPMPAIINIGHKRQLDLAIEVPRSELGAVASHEMWDEIYERIAHLAKENRSTLIFVNTRRLAERVAHHLTERLGEDKVAAHHGSLSRKIRLQAETRLKNGELTALVATASLELGIDIGSIDLVCQIGSPRAIATGLQRVGRAGHWHAAISKGRFFATTRDELLECAALIKAIQEEDLDQLIVPLEPLDVLAQQIVALCATDDWDEDRLFQLIKKAYPYRNLTRETFLRVLTMLAEGIAGSRGRYGAYLFRDQVNHQVKARRHSRLTAITSGGAIPDNGLFTVVAEPDGTMVGTLDEDFAVESTRGDIILLGTTSWLVRRVESASGRVLVEDAKGAPPSIPFWVGEAPARTKELSLQVSSLRENIENQLALNSSSTIEWLIAHCGVDIQGAEQLLNYIAEGKKVLGAVPTQKRIIAERFFDEGGGMQLVIHSPFGARINKAWGLALRKRFCRSFNFELQAAATDDGLNIALAEQHSFPLADVFRFLNANTLKEVLIQAVLQSPIFKIRWRWTAVRALALVRFRSGKKVPPHIMRILSDDLLAAVFPDAAACQDNLAGEDIQLPSHPLIDETMKDALTEALDVEGLTKVIEKLGSGEIECLAVDTPMPSVFAHGILNANPYAFLDDAPLEERRTRAVQMRRTLPQSVLDTVGKLDQGAIEEVRQQAWPDIRNPDELHDFLQTVIALPPEKSWQVFLDELEKQGRATQAISHNQSLWVCAEKIESFLTVYPQAQMKTALKRIEKIVPSREAVILEMIKGWVFHLGPTTNRELQQKLHLESNDIEIALVALETSGLILRGQFRTQITDLEWCERRLLSRIHRMTITQLREAIQPVTALQFMHWLLEWQHIAPGTQLVGEQGLFQIINQLQGFEAPANAWEKQIYAKRVLDYDPAWLDRFCLGGAVGWGRLSPVENKSMLPRSIAPITFFVREEMDWMLPAVNQETEMLGVSFVADLIYRYLQQKGASFFADIVRGVARLQAEVESGLWELVALGRITADGFDNLRALIDPKRRSDQRRRRMQMRYSTGRWSILAPHALEESAVRLEATCWMLLNRYGVVFRDLLVRERNIPRWRELLLTFRRMEEKGEVRGGRFVDGFLGEQFALPYAVTSLRARKNEVTSSLTLSIAAVDPLNLVGIILPGDKVSALSTKQVIIH